MAPGLRRSQYGRDERGRLRAHAGVIPPGTSRASAAERLNTRVAVLAGGLLALAALLATAVAPTGAAGRAPACWTGKRAYLTPAEIHQFTHWKFTRWLSVRYAGYPRHFIGKPPPDVKLFRSGRTRGFLINISLKGKYRRENNAEARKLGYPIGKWPLVPLFGQIVADHTGILEVYEDSWAWKSAKGAKSYMGDMADTGGRHFAVGLGDASFGVIYPQAKSTAEKGVQVMTRVGAMATRLSLEGGRKVNARKATRLAAEALAISEAACRLSPRSGTHAMGELDPP
ncbi:MAG TPA: hypothetical protein VFB34_08325 [Chloroflexota bacterium]|nr:hypothetical protein [Chloroflexota bacterium]